MADQSATKDMLSKIKRHLPAIGTLFLLNLIVFAKLVFRDRHGVPHATIPYDFASQYSVWLVYIGDCFKSGFFPLWSPYVAAGTPFFINPQSQLYSPLTLLIAPTIGYTQFSAQLQAVFMLFFGGCGAYALAYALWRTRWAALVSGICFNFTSAIFGNLEHMTIINSAALLPWLFWATTKTSRGKQAWAYPVLSFFIYFLITSGYPGVIIMTLLWLAASTIYLIYLNWNTARENLFVVLRHALAWLLGLGLAAAHWLPIVIHRKEFTRGTPLSLTTALSGGNLFFKHLWGMLFQFMTENPLPGPEIDVSMRGVYFGALAIPLALTAVFLIKDRIVPVLLGLTVLAFLMACGSWFFGRVFLHILFPVLNMSRFPSADSRSLMVLGWALLAGGGITLLQANVERARRLMLWACLGLLGALVLGLFGLSAVYPAPIYDSIVINFLTAEILFVAAAALVLRAYAGRWLVACLTVLLALELGTCVLANPKVWTEPVMTPEKYQAVVMLHRRVFSAEAALGPRLTAGNLPSAAEPGHPADDSSAGDETGRLTGDVLTGEESGRGYLAKTFYLSDYNPLRLYRFEHLLEGGYTDWLINGARVVSVPAGSQPQTYEDFRKVMRPVEFRLTSYTPNQIAYSVRLPQDALVVFNEVYFPGWRATVDGRSVDMLEVSGGLRAVQVGAGEHTIVTTFRPRSFYLGLFVSLLSLVIFLVWLVLSVYPVRGSARVLGKRTPDPSQ